MSEVWFYHLTREPLEVALPKLIQAARDKAGWRVLIRGRDREQLAWLDEKLWLVGGEESFLAHGMAGGDHDAAQPVLLSDGADCPNAAECLMTIDGAAVTPEDVTRHTRVCVVFDGNDEAAVTFARGQWREAADAGWSARYQSQENGRWELKASSGD